MQILFNLAFSQFYLYNLDIYIYVYLTNRFHVAVRLFSNRSQMTSKCGKNKKVAHEVIAKGPLKEVSFS